VPFPAERIKRVSVGPQDVPVGEIIGVAAYRPAVTVSDTTADADISSPWPSLTTAIANARLVDELLGAGAAYKRTFLEDAVEAITSLGYRIVKD